MKNAIAFHPSKGIPGSVYRTTDGKTYCRTTFGTRELDATCGTAIYFHQQVQRNIIRRVTKSLIYSCAVCLVIGLALGLLT